MGAISGEELSYIAERVNTVLRMVPDGTERSPVAEGVDYLVLPETDERQALADSLELFTDTDPRVPLIASGGLNAANVVDVVQNFPVFGVDVRSGVESAPGVKDPGDSG